MPVVKPAPNPIEVIRLTLSAGVLMFGAVILVVHRRPGWSPGTLPAAVLYAQVAWAVLAVVIARVMRVRVLSESDPERRRSLLIAGWAVGEAAGLLGAVIFFTTGQGQWYLLGLAAMLTVFALLPTSRAS